MVVIVAFLVFVLLAAAETHHRWVVSCENRGGHVITKDNHGTGIGFDSDGNAVAVFTGSTDYYCISASGGILDIK